VQRKLKVWEGKEAIIFKFLSKYGDFRDMRDKEGKFSTFTCIGELKTQNRGFCAKARSDKN